MSTALQIDLCSSIEATLGLLIESDITGNVNAVIQGGVSSILSFVSVTRVHVLT